MIEHSSNILLVTDSGEVKQGLAATLQDLGYRVVCCESISEVRSIIQQQPPDVAIASVGSVGGDSEELLEILYGVDPAVELILLADTTEEGAFMAGPSGGVPGYIASPFRPNHVGAAVRHALQLKNLTMENRRLGEGLRQANLKLNKALAEQQRLEEAQQNSATNQSWAGSEVLMRSLADLEDERKHLAETLHDDILVSLAAVGMELALLRRQAKDVSAELEEGLAQLGNTVKDTDRTLRKIVWGIFPSVLTNLGLVPALRSYLEQLSSTPILSPHSLEVELRSTGFDNDRLPPQVEIGLYRVIQQGVANVIQHAGAKKLRVGLSWSDTELDLLITDDGVGFNIPDTSEATQLGRAGLLKLRDRIEELGGTIQITSEGSVGTTIRARVPTQSGSGNAEISQTTSYYFGAQN